MSTPLQECERRDVKGLYARARRGEITNFTGIDDPYEPPIEPALQIDTSAMSLSEAANLVMGVLEGADPYAAPASATQQVRI